MGRRWFFLTLSEDDIPDDFEEITADDNIAGKIDEEIEDLFDDGEELKELNF